MTQLRDPKLNALRDAHRLAQVQHDGSIQAQQRLDEAARQLIEARLKARVR